jgi:hypothetical protein
MGVSGQRHAPAALYPRGKDPRYPLYRRLGGPQSRSGHRGYRKNPLPLPGIEPRSPGIPARYSSPVFQPGIPARSQTLYWLSYPAPNYSNSGITQFNFYCLPESYKLYQRIISCRNFSINGYSFYCYIIYHIHHISRFLHVFHPNLVTCYF